MQTLHAKQNDLLTDRQTEIVPLVALGKDNEEIGMIIGISPRGAKFHVEGAMNNLDVHSRAHLVTEAFRHGILQFMCVTLMMLGVAVTLISADTDLRVGRGGLRTTRFTRNIRSRNRREGLAEPLELIAAV